MLKTKSELIRFIKSYDPKKIVFWIGAGIDSNTPTNLPRAPILLNQLLKWTCGIEYSKKISEQWDLVHGGIPRMETVISEIKLFESELAVGSNIVNGFSSFLEAPPNDCHQILAQYLKYGSNIVTLNYTNTLVKAFNLQYGNVFPVEPAFDNAMQMFIYSNEQVTSGKIYHPHGVANDLNTIGISLNEVKKTLSSNFKALLSKWIESGFCFIFLGYSCSDTLDINPFFESFKSDLDSGSTGIIINHASEESFGDENQDSNKKILLSSFRNTTIFNTDTSEFLKEITLEKYSSCLNDDFEGFNWTSEFGDKAKPYDERLNKYISLRLIKTLGLNINEILPLDWYKHKDYKLFKQNWYIDYYFFICLSQSGNLMQTRRFAKNLKYNSLAMSDMYAKLLLTKKAAKVAHPILDVYKIISETNWTVANWKIDWNLSTSLNRNAEWIILDIFRSPLSFKRKQKRHKSLADKILESNKIIIDLGNDYVLDFFQILTALRYYGVLLMIYKNEYDDAINYIKQASYHYDSISSIAGVIRCNIYLSFVELLNYKVNHQPISLDLAKTYLENIKSIPSKSVNPKDKYLYALIKFYIAIQ